MGIWKNATSIRIQAMKIKANPTKTIVRIAPMSSSRPPVLNSPTPDLSASVSNAFRM